MEVERIDVIKLKGGIAVKNRLCYFFEKIYYIYVHTMRLMFYKK